MNPTGRPRQRYTDGANAQWNHVRVFHEHNEPPHICYDCDGVVEDDLNVHHVDGDHGNDEPENLVAMHRGCHIALHRRGRKASVEERRKLRDAHIGISPTEETRKKLSEALKGKPWSEARRQAHTNRTNRKKQRRAELDD